MHIQIVSYLFSVTVIIIVLLFNKLIFIDFDIFYALLTTYYP